jgi:hypothetical protein
VALVGPRNRREVAGLVDARDQPVLRRLRVREAAHDEQHERQRPRLARSAQVERDARDVRDVREIIGHRVEPLARAGEPELEARDLAVDTIDDRAEVDEQHAEHGGRVAALADHDAAGQGEEEAKDRHLVRMDVRAHQ